MSSEQDKATQDPTQAEPLQEVVQEPSSTPEAIGEKLPEVEIDPGSTAEFDVPIIPPVNPKPELAFLPKKETRTPLTWAASSHVGNIRPHNEDSYLAEPPLFLVCDGMGGHEGGEIASAIATQTIAEKAPTTADDTALGLAVEDANLAVINAALQGQGKAGMGTTATSLIVEGNKVALSHVGDSRCYLLHEGALTRVTQDHSFVEELVAKGEITADEARVHPSRSIITRALGSDPDMYADHFSIRVQQHDRLMLCSDGLSTMITDAEIEDIMTDSGSAVDCVENLLNAALTSGGYDNVTCIVIDIEDDGVAQQSKRGTRRAVITWIASALAILALMLGALGFYTYNTWYITTVEGLVTVYHGLPGELLGVELSEVDNITSIKAEELPKAVQDRLAEGIMVNSYEDVDNLLQEYRNQIEEKRPALQEADKNAGAAPAASSSETTTPVAPEATRSAGVDG